MIAFQMIILLTVKWILILMGVKESVEINSSFTNDEGTVLFAYKLDVLVG